MNNNSLVSDGTLDNSVVNEEALVTEPASAARTPSFMSNNSVDTAISGPIVQESENIAHTAQSTDEGTRSGSNLTGSEIETPNTTGNIEEQKSSIEKQPAVPINEFRERILDLPLPTRVKRFLLYKT